MKKENGSLTFPSNPLARLQQLRAQVDTPSIPTTDEASDGASRLSGTDASNETLPLRVDETLNEASSFPTAKERILRQANSCKEATSRLNVELRDSLHKRLKRYCATNGVPIRLVVDVLIEDFLSEQAIAM